MNPKDSNAPDHAYARIGVRPFINCCGTRTIHGGSIMVPEALWAMNEASRRFVNIDELMEAVGRRLAELTGAEWGIVTSGAAAALTHATAACVAGADPEKMLRLPNTAGMRNRVVMLKGQRFTYDHAIRAAGVEIINVESREEFLDALVGPVAMVAILGSKEAEGNLRLEEIADHARPRGIPILVDAASEHLKRPISYLARGAHLVAYSGGKFLRGPQPTGLLLGEKTLVEAAWRNAAPHHALGRAMKIGKEEIMGALAAIEVWASRRDPAEEYARWEGDLAVIASEVARVPSVTAEILKPEGTSESAPRLEVRWDEGRIAITGLDLRECLLNGEPRIMLDDRGATECSVFVISFSLEPGEAKIVGSRLREELAAAPGARARPVSSPPVFQVEGEWELTINFIRGSARHRVSFEQDGSRLTGTHRMAFLENQLTGDMQGGNIRFASLHPYEGTNLSYRFSGTVCQDRMEGIVELGSTGTSAPGPLNQQEYGEGRWMAVRRA